MVRSLLGSLVVGAGFLASLAQAAPQNPPASYPVLGKIVRVDPGFDQLVPQDARIEVVASGLDWSEGPVWVPEENCLLFSDIPRNSVMKWKADEGLSLFLKPSGYTGAAAYGNEPGSNGILRDPRGRLVFCEHGDRRISRLEPDGGKRTLVDNYRGKRLNSPNDGTFRANGDLYFTDPPYGLPKQYDDPRRELDFCGVYRLSAEGQLQLLTKDLARPNGIALSPDEKTLYVAQSDPQAPIWMAYDVQSDGSIARGRVFYDSSAWLKAGKRGLPDGMKTDARGNVWATGPGGVHVFSAAGKHLGTLDTGEATANCAFGDDGSTLYITADMYLCRVKTTSKGR